MTDLDDLAPPSPASKPPDFENMSIEELGERIAGLEAEIVRIRGVIARKKAHRGDADGLFRS